MLRCHNMLVSTFINLCKKPPACPCETLQRVRTPSHQCGGGWVPPPFWVGIVLSPATTLRVRTGRQEVPHALQWVPSLREAHRKCASHNLAMAHCKADLPMVQASVSLLAMPGARWQYEEVCRRLGGLFRDNTRAVHTLSFQKNVRMAKKRKKLFFFV